MSLSHSLSVSDGWSLCSELVGGIQGELDGVSKATVALNDEFRILAKEFLHGLQKERQADNGPLTLILTLLSSLTTLLLPAVRTRYDSPSCHHLCCLQARCSGYWKV